MNLEFFNGFNLKIYVAITAITSYFVYDSLMKKPNFYTAGILMFQGPHLISLMIWLLCSFLLFGKVLQMIMFGELRVIELEHIHERAWYTVTNMLMVIATFSDEDRDLSLAILLAFELLSKVFHWVLEDRLEATYQQISMEDVNDVNDDEEEEEDLEDVLQTTSYKPLLNKLHKSLVNRYVLLLIMFLYIDHKTVMNTNTNQIFVQSFELSLVFELEFWMIYTRLIETTLKFILNVIELLYLEIHKDEENWENKQWVLKIGCILIGLANTGTVLFLFIGMIYAHILSLNFTMEIYRTIMDLFKNCKDLMYMIKSSRELEKNLNIVTIEDLKRDDLCIICRDDMVLNDSIGKNHRTCPRKLNCGHILHYGCLKSWLGRSHVCPTCRNDVFKKNTNTTFATQQQHDQQQQEQQQQEHQPTEEEAEIELRENYSTDIMHTLRPLQESVPSETETQPQPQTETQTETQPPITNDNLATNNEYSIILPYNALIPRDWTVIPMKRREAKNPSISKHDSNGCTRIDEEYDILLNKRTKGVFKVLQKDE
ncbi:hypothetical protein CANARDRAFT_222822 [[Candida] arabinofermentans NRRL YB-2248]|uniref:RING-type E3 ubiquitin transferase n=1 Tax=[Candida] arabinofermentans NRRL YB-2248 TaxID=983967 RepID=A0A1E4SYY8_9ASCO|nr:hypothetical protein CANARDRAFT_222822 [[Candida] arabinofermentans NRRL YB-2248]